MKNKTVVPNNSPKPDYLHPRRRQQIFLDRNQGANQSDAAGTNINSIVAQYRKDGTVPNVHSSNPLYGDYTFPDDIHEMREAVYEAETRFKQLPADVRSLCDNDWVEFMTQFNDPEQREELITAGLKINDPDTTSPDKTVTTDKTDTLQKSDQVQTENKAAGGPGGLPPDDPASKSSTT